MLLFNIAWVALPSWAQGLLQPLSISSSSFLPLLAGGVIACCIHCPREGKCVSLTCLQACWWGISDHLCFFFHWKRSCSWVCEILAHGSWQHPNLDAQCCRTEAGKRYIYIMSLALPSCRSYWRTLISHPCKNGLKERGCQCERWQRKESLIYPNPQLIQWVPLP